jgi:hypothetical protein
MFLIKEYAMDPKKYEIIFVSFDAQFNYIQYY